MLRICLTLLFMMAIMPAVHAQNLFGIWQGNQAYGFGWHQPDKVVLELNEDTDSTFTGISHTYYGNQYYEHYVVKGSIDRSKHSIIVREVGTISVKIGAMDQNYPGTYSLTYSCSDTFCQMNGYWRPFVNPSIFVAKRIGSSFYKTIHTPKPPVKDTVPVVVMPKPKPQPPVIKDTTPVTPTKPLPAVVTPRKEDIQSLIEINPKEVDSIHLAIYDNGEIDNDTISLFFNDRLLVNKKMISLKPINVAIALKDITPFSKLKLYAENLGTIPPCTALMVIMVGKKRYEVNLSSDFRKNATVEFFLKE
ncbi:MAG: hypothetical protein JST86_13785 [Bacteroidetes bacterium]|nr:hypothetical protein [Bacteroidota bacterium]